ncbi:holin [uncultured Lactobacillus sp.]|uniref:holin n=1 Tax=uncultured Lactobacillus sp. TaxID=153152 RepID=UPI0026133C85|nr:holin [uncultured Lactobacillus sp.]
MNKTDLVINVIWAFVIVLGTLTSAFYLHSKTKIAQLRIKHPQLADVFDFIGTLALRASNYQASIDGKDGSKKLDDATNEVYKQIKSLYPQLPIDESTIRNYVQHAYDDVVKSDTGVEPPVEPIEIPKVSAPDTPVHETIPEVPKENENQSSASPQADKSIIESPKENKDELLDDLHV